MKTIPKTHKDNMGRFNNGLVQLIDETKATPPQVVLVLRAMADRIESAFLSTASSRSD